MKEARVFILRIWYSDGFAQRLLRPISAAVTSTFSMAFEHLGRWPMLLFSVAWLGERMEDAAGSTYSDGGLQYSGF